MTDAARARLDAHADDARSQAIARWRVAVDAGERTAILQAGACLVEVLALASRVPKPDSWTWYCNQPNGGESWRCGRCRRITTFAPDAVKACPTCDDIPRRVDGDLCATHRGMPLEGCPVCLLYEAYGYLARLFRQYAPQCEPLFNLMGVCSQIDNLLATSLPPEKRTEDYYDPTPPSDSPFRHDYTLDMAMLRESRDQWKARAEELAAAQQLPELPADTDYWLREAQSMLRSNGSDMHADKIATIRAALASSPSSEGGLRAALEQRDRLLVELKSLRALIREFGVQDADDWWSEAVARADAVILSAEVAALASTPAAAPTEAKP